MPQAETLLSPGMASPSPWWLGDTCCLLQMVHKAVVEVDESGTRAAAATETIFMFKSAPMSSQRVMFNRPFMMLIVENSTNVLFFGKVTHP